MSCGFQYVIGHSSACINVDSGVGALDTQFWFSWDHCVLTAISMLDPADAITNIELAGK